MEFLPFRQGGRKIIKLLLIFVLPFYYFLSEIFISIQISILAQIWAGSQH